VADIRKPGVRRVVGALEEGMIGWLRDQGLPAERKEGFPGAWCGGAKVAAIGLHVQRGVSIHGFSLNLVNDLKTFAAIVPCGIEDGEVTTVERLGGPAISPEAAAPGVAKRVLDALGALI
jgi:lipoyl(octanoyl) transferase